MEHLVLLKKPAVNQAEVNMSIGIGQLLLVLLIVVLLFGTRKLRSLGSDFGAAIKSFRSAVKENDATKTEEKSEPNSVTGNVIDGEVSEKEKSKTNV